jgi:hypothetical protein
MELRIRLSFGITSEFRGGVPPQTPTVGTPLYECTVDLRDEVFWQIVCVARYVTCNLAVFGRVTQVNST